MPTTNATTPSMQPTNKTFLTVGELAARWSVSKRSVERLIRTGRLETTKIGRAVRIALTEVLRFEAMNRSSNFQ